MPLTVIIIGGVALVAASSALFSGITIKTDAEDIAITAAPASEGQTTAPQVPAQTLPPDQTAALPSDAISPAAETQALSFNAPIVDNEAEIAILEVIQIPPVEDEIVPSVIPAVVPQDKPDAPKAVAQAAPSGLKSAVINKAVNLRAAPDKNAKVLLVVPQNAAIEAQDNCTWCAVTYQGSQGYVYNSFIDYR